MHKYLFISVIKNIIIEIQIFLLIVEIQVFSGVKLLKEELLLKQELIYEQIHIIQLFKLLNTCKQHRGACLFY